MHAIAFAPILPLPLFAALSALAVLFSLYGLIKRARGAIARLIAFAMLVLAVANPSIVHQTKDDLSDIAVVLLDRSQSMRVGDRGQKAEAALKQVQAALKRQGNLDLKLVTVENKQDGEGAGTMAFTALADALDDVPPSRLAGAILITDGEIHDVPAKPGIDAPVNALIIGAKNEADRKLAVVDAARYAIVGKSAKIALRIDDLGGVNRGTARIHLRIDGADAGSRDIPLGQDATITADIAHEGENVIEIEAAPGPAEMTLQNNRAVVTVHGVRDRLRVLLVSGEPNAGERVWRAFLKGDPSVDLVHFTILRPPEKQWQDRTPQDELSLIPFPTDELFGSKLNGFDLIVFDRYSERGILPLGYFENIANYVENGGALLISAGPEFAGDFSIFRTPLAAILPASPSGRIIAKPFKPRLTKDGLAHPVTDGLTGANTEDTPPGWGRWFRQIVTDATAGSTVMEANGYPLLVLARVRNGRIAELLSDQGYLWARGFEGGGPQAELLRRTAHWLMKEPELEEEALRAHIDGSHIAIDLRTMAEEPPPLILTDPDGKHRTLTLTKSAAGRWHATASADSLGLYRAQCGKLSAVAAAGPLNPKEVSDLRATADVLRPIATETGGAVRWMTQTMPAIKRLGRGRHGDGKDITLAANGATRVASIEQTPLLPPWLALILVLASLGLAWRQEGK